MIKSGYVYILKSIKTGRCYIGSTQNLNQRIKDHSSGKTFYVHRYIGIFTLVFKQKYSDIKSARNAEKWSKAQKDKDFLERIITEKKLNKKFE